jgi:hypothetical protein
MSDRPARQAAVFYDGRRFHGLPRLPGRSAPSLASLREGLVVRGLVVKGMGRGGSTARTSGAASGSGAFTLEGEAAPAADAAGTPATAPKTKPGKPKARAADACGEAQVLNYRHANRRRNNPAVGLVNEASNSPMDSAKRDALALWVKAVNAKGGFGAWCWDVAFKPAEIHDILVRHGSGVPATKEALVLSGGAD